jgi:hypothetical protein
MLLTHNHTPNQSAQHWNNSNVKFEQRLCFKGVFILLNSPSIQNAYQTNETTLLTKRAVETAFEHSTTKRNPLGRDTLLTF